MKIYEILQKSMKIHEIPGKRPGTRLAREIIDEITNPRTMDREVF